MPFMHTYLYMYFYSFDVECQNIYIYMCKKITFSQLTSLLCIKCIVFIKIIVFVGQNWQATKVFIPLSLSCCLCFLPSHSNPLSLFRALVNNLVVKYFCVYLCIHLNKIITFTRCVNFFAHHLSDMRTFCVHVDCTYIHGLEFIWM